MIAVIDFGMGNIHSCLKALSLYTNSYKLISNPEDLKDCSGIVLPGDGAFQRAMENLNSSGFTSAISEKVKSGIPILGICIGFQILFSSSDETIQKSDTVPGFGFLMGDVKRFRGKNYKIPHMGWNRIYIEKRKNIILQNIESGSYMYFIHSYRPVNVDKKNVVATCSYYDEKFPVVVENENIYGTQFHPEKSDYSGLKILENFVKVTI
jgi:imidazole glycerol-phosphate synthase subunit HisH